MARGPSRSMWKRTLFVGAFMVLFFGLLIYRTASIAIIKGSEYQQKAIQQQLRDTIISPERGTIYDRNMKPLAKSASVSTVVIAPATIKSEEQRNLICDKLSEILGVDRDFIYERAQRHTYYEIIKRKIEEDEKQKVLEFINEHKIKCINLVPDFKRYYPFGNFASNLLGFTGIDNQGLSGIEWYYESYLKGVPGRIVAAKNALGTDMPFNYETRIEPKNGSNLVLTIDEIVQHYLEKYIEVAVKENNVTNRATGIVMDVNTGEILAMTTKPDFDPNKPFEIYDQDILGEIMKLPSEQQKDAISAACSQQWRNKAISDTYEPGSVFKIITAAMCLEEKVTKPTEMFNDTGSIKIADRKFRCWRAGGHGSESFVEAMMNSCNPIFIEVAQRLGPSLFSEYFKAFGLTETTGIDLPGEATSIYHKEGEMKVVELASSSFGQTFRVTPIQLITAVSAVANGGKLLQPYVVKHIIDDNNNIIESFGPKVKRQVISKEVAQQVLSMMEEVVDKGTGKNAQVSGYRIAGKTGTSEKIDKVDESGRKNERISSFCAVAPVDNPKIAILILLDEPHGDNIGGGTIVAPIVSSFLADVLPYLGIAPTFTQEELEKMDVNTPNLVGKELQEAENVLKNSGLKPRIVGHGETVLVQIPEAGKPIPRNGTVVIYTDQERKVVKVPDLLGLSPADTNIKAVNSGLNIRMTGGALSGTAPTYSYKQSIEPGTEVPLGTVITVEFIFNDISE